jgi:polysaccharide export outer membrane protein
VTLLDIAAKQQIAGEHLVGPDGTVTLGSYGSVSVVGLTLAQARQAIEDYLSQFLEEPEVSVDVFAYNSKVYYVVTQGAGLGDGLYRFPITGNETVLDAISQISGLGQVSSKRIWIARPTHEPGTVQVLPVSWEAITAQASASTNYQILPGDRVFVAEDRLIAFDTALGKLTAPIERVIGFSLLGAGAATRFSGRVLQGGGNNRNTF